MSKLSRKSKWMVFSSLALSLALIVTILLYVSRANAGQTDKEFWFIVGMIGLAVVSFAFVLIFKLRKGRYVRLLNAEYYTVYEKICDALNTSVLGLTERREIKLDILSILMEGQESGRPVRDVVGSDIGKFVDGVSKSFGYRSSFVFDLMSSVQYGIVLVTFIQLIIYFEHLGEKSFFEAEIGLSMFIMFLPLIFVIYPLIKRMMRKENSVMAFVLPIVYGVVFIGLLIFTDNVFGNVPWVRYVLDTDIRMIFSWWMAVILAAAALLSQIVKWALRRQSVKEL